MAKRSVACPAVETDVSQLAYLAAQLQAVIGVLDSANAEDLKPFMCVPAGRTEDQLMESLKAALFDQAEELADTLRAGLAALADDEEVA